MVAIAAFAESKEGRFYGLVCEHWGVDPAAGMADDVLAYNLRAALLLAQTEAKDEAADPDDHDAGGRAFEQEWLSA